MQDVMRRTRQGLEQDLSGSCFCIPSPARGGRFWTIALFATLFLWGAAGSETLAVAAEQLPGSPPALVVEVATVIQKDVAISNEWVGTTDGLVNAKIRPQVSGYLLTQKYKEGEYLKKGDLLFEIDPRTFEASLSQAEGQLAQAKAKLGKASLDVKRYTPLAKEKAISQQELDDAIQNEIGCKAAVQSAQAQVDTAKLYLNFTKIASPIDGIAGTANAQIGDLVSPSQPTELTTVSTLDPIKVLFPISEQEYMLAVKSWDNPESELERKKHRSSLELFLADGSKYPFPGQFSFADRQVDEKTGSIRIAALFPNENYLLRPGQYARIRTVTHSLPNALLVPQRAVTEMQGVAMLAVVGPDNKIAIRNVKTGPRSGGLWVISEGLKPGERVVVEGVQKVRDGMTVTPKLVSTESPATGAKKE
jgi:membrane fusion protein (multidrug efflux system)